MTPEQVKALSDDELRIRVAELVGWTNVQQSDDAVEDISNIGCGFVGTLPKCDECNKEFLFPVPDYPYDLNACHEMEEAIKGPDAAIYTSLLTIDNPWMHIVGWNLLHATARQRCEAFVIAMS